MISMRLATPGDLRTDRLVATETDTPQPLADDVLIEVAACGVCRTDLQLTNGDLSHHLLPITPGHQIVGRIVGAGPQAEPDRIGQTVGVGWIGGACQRCARCLSGRENLCEQAKFTGWDRDGGYASQVLARSDYAITLPSGLTDNGQDLGALAPLLCGGSIGYRSLRIAGIGPTSSGLRLGLFGYGASATLVLQLARHWGCEIYVMTRTNAEAERAIAAGATWASTYDQPLPVRLDAAITFAPVGDIVIKALQNVDRGGTVAINAIHLDQMPAFNYGDLWWERSLRSVANVTRADIREFLDLVATIGLTTMFETIPLREANQALRRLDAGDVRGSFVLTDMTQSVN